jgi:hypothetical protein
MLSEKDCNLFIKKKLDWGFKIPDSDNRVKNQTVKRPFDGFGVALSLPVYWESKYFPEPKKRVTRKELFSRKHQVENLLSILSSFGDGVRLTVNCLVMYCVFMRTTDARKLKLYVIANSQLKDMYLSDKNSFTIDELARGSNRGVVLSTNLEKESMDFWKMLEGDSK